MGESRRGNIAHRHLRVQIALTEQKGCLSHSNTVNVFVPGGTSGICVVLWSYNKLH